MSSPWRHSLELSIQPQPTDSTCGHTCLQAVYGYWGDDISLDQVIAEVGELSEGGTMAVQLACHALARGYDATIYTYNLFLFDPTWFTSPKADLTEKLRKQSSLKCETDPRIAIATEAYLNYLDLGGHIEMKPLEEELIVASLIAGTPILSGLSATFLYQEARERGFPIDEKGVSGIEDDVGGLPVGHFVVLSGYDSRTAQVMLADPLSPNPFGTKQIYAAPLSQVAAAILLGIATYDANLLLITPRTKPEEES